MAVDQDAVSAHLALVSRARDLTRDLHVAQQLLTRIDGRLRERVWVRMGTPIATLSRRAAELYGRAQQSSPVPAESWANVHALRYEVDALLEECLLLLDGSAERAMGFDDGYCVLADALVDELVRRTPIEHWNSFTVVGRSESYWRSSRVISVRFPATSVWDLPVVAHELGHFVGPALVEDAGLQAAHPLDLLFDERGDGTEQSWSRLQELFADAFASHLLGPAYGFTCVLVTFDPLLALLPSETHPAAHHRVQVVRAMLESAGDENVTWAAKRLGELWDGLVEAAGGTEGREPLAESPFVVPIVELLANNLPLSRYASWSSAESVAEIFAAGSASRSTLPPATMPDILNGAWLARLRAPSVAAADDVASKALAWCRSTLPEVG